MRRSGWAAVIAAALAGAAGGLAVVGAVAPWFRFSFLGLTADISGTSQDLYGRYALALGVTAIVTAVAVLVAGPRHVIVLPGALALGATGSAGLVVMHLQGRHLTNAKALINSSAFGEVNKVFAAHTVPTWGFWLDVGAFAGLIVIGVGLAVAAGMVQRTRSAPPSTGMTHPVRYDAAGDNANAAT
jgi:hypothetical protein